MPRNNQLKENMLKNEDIRRMEANAWNKTNDINEKIKDKLDKVEQETLKDIDTKLQATKLEVTRDLWTGDSSQHKYNLSIAERYLEAAQEKAQAVIDKNPPIVSQIEKKSLEKDISYSKKLEEKSHDYFVQDSSDLVADTEMPMYFDDF